MVHVLANGSIRTANQEALRILGLTYDELTESYVESFETQTILEDGSPCPPEAYPVTRALAEGTPQGPVTIGVRNPSGEISWADFTAVPLHDAESGQVSGAIVTFLDITQRRNMDAKLRRSEARLRSILDSAPLRILHVGLEGEVAYANRPLIDAQLEVKPGSRLARLFDDNDVERVERAFGRAITDQATVRLEAKANPRFSNAVYSVSIAPLLQEDEVVGATVVLSELTRERELRASLMASDRLVAVGTLAAGVAHEINNPLTYVLANLVWVLRMLETGDANLDRVQKLLNSAKDGAERIATVVSDLLTHARDDRNEPKPVSVQEAVRRAVQMTRHETRYRANVIVDLPADLPGVLAHDARLGQVLVNLLLNAAHAIDEGQVDENTITVQARAHNGVVEIQIIDTGSGVPPEIADKVFEPFVTAKAVGHGSGLGLFVCRNIIQSYGGSIRLESRPSGGSTVTLRLRSSASPPPRPRRDTPDQGRVLGRRVLVIDDEPLILNSFARMLQGNDVTGVGSGAEALRLLEAGNFDVVFCDLIMPTVTGMDVFEAVERSMPHYTDRFVFMTGGAFTERAKRFLERESHRLVLFKPFGIAAVRQAVRAITS